MPPLNLVGAPARCPLQPMLIWPLALLLSGAMWGRAKGYSLKGFLERDPENESMVTRLCAWSRHDKSFLRELPVKGFVASQHGDRCDLGGIESRPCLTLRYQASEGGPVPGPSKTCCVEEAIATCIPNILRS